MKRITASHGKERGFILLIYVVAAAFVILVLGLAIDAGYLYMVRVRLQAAGDAAALAAARSLNLSLSASQQTADAANAATSFFNANFPTGVFGTNGASLVTTMTYGAGSQSSTLNITTVANANAPTYFMRWLGYSTVPLRTTGTASRRDLNLVLLLDKSGSMNNVQPGTSQTACELMRIAAGSFIDMFSNNRDTVGLVLFNGGSETIYSPQTNFNPAIKNSIDGITCDGFTGTVGGLNRAWQELQTLNQPTKLNVIVLFTDGLAQSIIANFPKKAVSDNRYGDGQGAFPSTSALYAMGPSGCIPAFIAGTLSAGSDPALTGGSSGIRIHTNLNTQPVSAAGCGFSASPNTARRDIAYIPDTDLFGNSTHGHRLDWDPSTLSYSSGQDTFPYGAYAGKIRPDQPRTIINAAYNATESQGIAIRNNATLNPMIVTIGLGGNTSWPADAELMIRLANVPDGTDPSGTVITNSIFDNTKQQGLYVYSPSSEQLQAAFSKVASFLVELTK